ncbi:ejaculatory bulb-specific protein 3-like isoform X1 [Schistocerca serialis cubense]|uniref:ejaculatory bulb-specific protein 3-like isoform X1 n=1 Tax=Schistocerca serialis cubense TaxID=2023355 RepID=UPI00214F5294|nr:ejaculatory bulb-specific protein 3-like isoform X1 [Schistocerca serialis cubense]
MARCSFVLLAAALALVAARSRLPSQLDDIDADEALADPARLDAAVSCFLSDADHDCNIRSWVAKSESLSFNLSPKCLIAEMVKTNCGVCSEGQKADITKFLAFISKNKPQEMRQLLARYDPNGEALVKFGDGWRQKGISV